MSENQIKLTPDLKKRLLKALTGDVLDLNEFPELMDESKKIQIEVIDHRSQVDEEYRDPDWRD